jgi:hypothetical protein
MKSQRWRVGELSVLNIAIIKISLLFICVAIVLIPINASAAKWVGVGDGWYVETDERSRNGDLSTVFVRSPNGEHGSVTFDCRVKKVIEPASWRDSKLTSDDSPIGKMYIAACKSWYEVWK